MQTEMVSYRKAEKCWKSGPHGGWGLSQEGATECNRLGDGIVSV